MSTPNVSDSPCQMSIKSGRQNDKVYTNLNNVSANFENPESGGVMSTTEYIKNLSGSTETKTNSHPSFAQSGIVSVTDFTKPTSGALQHTIAKAKNVSSIPSGNSKTLQNMMIGGKNSLIVGLCDKPGQIRGTMVNAQNCITKPNENLKTQQSCFVQKRVPVPRNNAETLLDLLVRPKSRLSAPAVKSVTFRNAITTKKYLAESCKSTEEEQNKKYLSSTKRKPLSFQDRITNSGNYTPVPIIDPSKKPESLQNAITMYIDYLVLENEMKTKISESDKYPLPCKFEKEDYFMNTMCKDTKFPSKKFCQWLRLFNLDIEVTEKADDKTNNVKTERDDMGDYVRVAGEEIAASQTVSDNKQVNSQSDQNSQKGAQATSSKTASPSGAVATPPSVPSTATFVDAVNAYLGKAPQSAQQKGSKLMYSEDGDILLPDENNNIESIVSEPSLKRRKCVHDL